MSSPKYKKEHIDERRQGDQQRYWGISFDFWHRIALSLLNTVWFLAWQWRYHDGEGSFPRARLMHCTPGVQTPFNLSPLGVPCKIEVIKNVLNPEWRYKCAVPDRNHLRLAGYLFCGVSMIWALLISVTRGVAVWTILIEKMLHYTAHECLAEGFHSRHCLEKKDQANQLSA